MKFRGIAGGKHPTLNKGDIIELEPREKLLAMAKEQISVNSPEGFRHIPVKAELLGEVSVTTGRQVKGKEDATQYAGKVKVKYRRLRLQDDRLFPFEEKVVFVRCKDCKNELGLPDLQTIEFKEAK